MKRYIIIVAGGKGARMKSATPKQFIKVNGLPLMMHTIRLFYEFDNTAEIIVVLPGQHFKLWKELCLETIFKIPHQLAEGGPARFHSVKSGLKLVKDDKALVAIHDAVRPFVNREVIERVFTDAEFYGNAIPGIPVNESVRENSGAGNHPVDRSKLVLVQTPQCFKANILLKAYLQNYREEFTDDASVVESDGVQIHLVNGNPENIKITTQSDLRIAEALLPNYSKNQD
jgi:2-C-methyl-D-erythritol 4-phosphate cytidylyltransferase